MDNSGPKMKMYENKINKLLVVSLSPTPHGHGCRLMERCALMREKVNNHEFTCYSKCHLLVDFSRFFFFLFSSVVWPIRFGANLQQLPLTFNGIYNDHKMSANRIRKKKAEFLIFHWVWILELFRISSIVRIWAQSFVAFMQKMYRFIFVCFWGSLRAAAHSFCLNVYVIRKHCTRWIEVRRLRSAIQCKYNTYIRVNECGIAISVAVDTGTSCYGNK